MLVVGAVYAVTEDGQRGNLDARVQDAPAWLIRAVTAGVFLIVLVKRFAGATSENFISTWSDDFFYYLKTAMNIVAGNGSTFDGTIPTNGYHPLWMGLVTSLVALTHSGSAALLPLAVIVSGTTTVTFALSRRLAARVLGTSGVASLVIALYSTCYFYVVAKHGMEINLTVPLMMFMTLRILEGKGALKEPRDTVLTGFLCALLVLSRTDSVVFVGIYVVAALTCRPVKLADAFRTGAYFMVGFCPVVVYLAYNIHYFGGILPVSGAAKQLAVGAWRHPKFRGFEFSNKLHFAFVFPVLAANLYALAVTLFRKGKEDTLQRRAAILPLLIFPQAFYLLQICMNDWPFWDWYLYPWLAAAPVVLSLTLRSFPGLLRRAELAVQGTGVRRLSLLCAVVAAIGLAAAELDYRQPQAPSSIYTFAVALTEFAKTHPGRYAMGDRAGMVGFVLPFPLLQLEGLMEDRKFLENIRSQRNLADVLREYGVDYYAKFGARPAGTCFQTTEPERAGPSSPRMSGTFCQRPAFVYEDAYGQTLVFATKQAEH